MWASILQNGRKIKKEDDSVDKIKQYIRLTDKSSYTSKLSKSAVGILRTESIKKNGKESKQNFAGTIQKQIPKNRGIGLTSNAYPLNIFMKVNKNTMSQIQGTKKSPIKINVQKTTSVVRIKKQQFQNLSSEISQIQIKAEYFLQCLKSKNKLRSQFHTNIHNSIITFKEFMKACRIAKEKLPDPNIKPETSGKKTLVFDMDQTLIHTNQSPTSSYELKVPFRSYQGRVGFGYVEVRPYAKQILTRLSKYFDIIIFTASTQSYADPIIDHLDPQKVIQHRLYRQSCTLVKNQLFVKDLRVIGRDLSNIVLIDNAPYSYMMQLGNAIPIIPFYKGKDDKQLLSLEIYLMSLKDVDDVRLINTRYFKLHEYIKYDSHDRLIKSLYPEWAI